MRLSSYTNTRRRKPRTWVAGVSSCYQLGLNSLRARKRRLSYEQSGGDLAFEPVNDLPGTLHRIGKAQERIVCVWRCPTQTPHGAAARAALLEHSYAEISARARNCSRVVGTLLARAEKEFEEAYQLLG